MPRNTESQHLVEALEAFWSPRRDASRLQVEPGNGASALVVTAGSEKAPWSARVDEAAESPFKVR